MSLDLDPKRLKNQNRIAISIVEEIVASLCSGTEELVIDSGMYAGSGPGTPRNPGEKRLDYLSVSREWSAMVQAERRRLISENGEGHGLIVTYCKLDCYTPLAAVRLGG